MTTSPHVLHSRSPRPGGGPSRSHRRGPSSRIRALILAFALEGALGGTAWAAYRRVHVWFDPSPTGIFDPSLVFPPGANPGWMVYSGVDYHFEPSGLVREVSTRVASSADGGVTWVMRAQVNAKEAGSLAGDAARALCGADRCDGYWISEVPFLVDDPTDVPARRFKLFTHRYFLYPPRWAAGGDTAYHLGAIRMRAAPTPEELKLAVEENAFRWTLSPPEVGPGGTEIPWCLTLSEGSGKSIFGQLFLTFACTFEAAPGDIRQRVIVLRSLDHARSWGLVGTALEPSDAALYGAKHFTAPDLFFAGGAAWLSATPVNTADLYAGCFVFLFEDLGTGRIHRPNGAPYVHRAIGTEGGRFGGACTFDDGVTSGLLMGQVEDGASDPFRIFDTGVRP